MPLSDDKRLFFKNLLSSYLPYLTQFAVTFVVTPLLVNRLGHERYAVYVLLFTVIGYFTLSNIGLPQTLVRDLIQARQNQDDDLINRLINSMLFYYLVIIGIVIGGVILLFYWDPWQIGRLLVKQPEFVSTFSLGMLLVSLSFAVSFLSELFQAVINAQNLIHVNQRVRLFQVVGGGVATYAALMLRPTVETIIVANVIVNALAMAAYYFFSRQVLSYRIDLRKRDWALFRSMLPSSFWYFLSGVSVILIFQADSILISSILGLTALSFYALMYRFSDIARQLLGTISNVLFPKVAAMFMERRYADIARLHNRMLLGMTALSCLGGVALYTAGYDFFRWWVGAENAAGRDVFIWFVLFTVLFGINQVSGLFLGAIGYHKNGVIVGIIQGIVKLGLGIGLARHYGITGIIMATVIALVLTNLWYSPYYFNRVVKNLDNCAS